MTEVRGVELQQIVGSNLVLNSFFTIFTLAIKRGQPDGALSAGNGILACAYMLVLNQKKYVWSFIVCILSMQIQGFPSLNIMHP
jgi:hypothetical protein